jgi:hypothetical protein
MNTTLTAEEVISVARCLTRFQSDITDYELAHFPELSVSQRASIGRALASLAATAGRLYAYSVQLVFADTAGQLLKLQDAARDLGRFLRAARKIAAVLDVVSAVAGLADAIMGHDVDGITSGIDNIIGIIAKD